MKKAVNKKNHWYDYLWIWSIIYFALGFFNILFAWLGMIDFILPLIFAIAGGNKWFCNSSSSRKPSPIGAKGTSLKGPSLTPWGPLARACLG